MKKKLKTINNFYLRLNKKRSFAFAWLFVLLIALPLFFLSGCAKTGYPQPPKISPPSPPVILGDRKLKNTVRIIYKYTHNMNKLKGFLIYRRYYKNKKTAAKYACSSSKPFAFQNLNFKKRFSLRYNKFFYDVNISNFKNGYYVFCAKSIGGFDIKSSFSNYKIVFIKNN